LETASLSGKKAKITVDISKVNCNKVYLLLTNNLLSQLEICERLDNGVPTGGYTWQDKSHVGNEFEVVEAEEAEDDDACKDGNLGQPRDKVTFEAT
jgi:hypothetical protein